LSKIQPAAVPAPSTTFLTQLRATSPRFRATADDLAAIDELSRLLGGDPGAVRLVAAQLSPREIRPAVDSLTRLLAELPDAWQAVLEFAYQRLPPLTRVCYRRLAVFEADFDAEAAMVACADASIGPEAIRGHLDVLAERLLIERAGDAADAVAGAACVAGAADAAGRHSGEGTSLIGRALTRDPHSRYRGDLLIFRAWISDLNVSPRQVIDAVEEAIAAARGSGARVALIRGLTTVGNAYCLTGDQAAARRHFEEAVALARRFGDPLTIAQCAHVYAWHLIGDDDLALAQAVMTAVPVGGPAEFASRASRHQYASFEFVLGALRLVQGDWRRAETAFSRSLDGYPPRDPSVCLPVEGLALVALAADQPARGLALIEAARKLRGAATASAAVPRWWSDRVAAAARAAEAGLPPRYARQVADSARRCTAQQAVDYAYKTIRLPYLHSADDLTGRELEIAVLVTDGLTNKQIAEQLRISGNTVSSHIQRIFTKLNIQSRAQLAAWMAGPLGGSTRQPELTGERHGSALGLLRSVRHPNRALS
jgi:DNA-binding CsgD family transcriptional regulator/tetratricopeptide (TPR) repeat protein